MSCTDPPLTTVRQPIEAIGRAAVEMLAGQIEGSAVSAEELFFEPEIVARGSTAAAPALSRAAATFAANLRNQYEICEFRSILAIICRIAIVAAR